MHNQTNIKLRIYIFLDFTSNNTTISLLQFIWICIYYWQGEYMKTEIEARLLDCNVKDIIKKLQANSAFFMGDWLQIRH